MMENPDFRVDYGTIVSCHLTRPRMGQAHRGYFILSVDRVLQR